MVHAQAGTKSMNLFIYTIHYDIQYYNAVIVNGVKKVISGVSAVFLSPLHGIENITSGAMHLCAEYM